MIETKTESQLRTMDRANRIVRTILAELEAKARPGVTTAELNEHAERRLKEFEAEPAFKGYPHPDGGPAFPAVLCTSVNEEIVHGIPSPARALREGDVLSLDFGCRVDGFYGDAAVTVPIGKVDAEASRLIEITRESLLRAVEQVRPGNRISSIGAAVQQHAEGAGFSVVRTFVGHGIGRRLHEEPPVPNFVDRSSPDPRLTRGLVLAIEPMITAGHYDVEVASDLWTARTRDRKLSAHFELSVAVTDNGPWILGDPA